MELITKEGMKKLREELQKLKESRFEIVEQLNEARDQGDLSENFGYHVAKGKLKDLDARVATIESKLSLCTIIEVKHDDFVQIGSYVKVFEENSQKEIMFRIISEDDYMETSGNIICITYKSLVARALLNKKVGDFIELKTPAGEKVYEILEITH